MGQWKRTGAEYRAIAKHEKRFREEVEDSASIDEQYIEDLKRALNQTPPTQPGTAYQGNSQEAE